MATGMTPGLATVVKAAERGPDSPLVRWVLGALVAVLGAASLALLALDCICVDRTPVDIPDAERDLEDTRSGVSSPPVTLR